MELITHKLQLFNLTTQLLFNEAGAGLDFKGILASIHPGYSTSNIYPNIRSGQL